MARTVLGDNPNCLAIRRTAALSQANPTASSKRSLKGALLGSCGTFSVFTPQFAKVRHRRRRSGREQSSECDFVADVALSRAQANSQHLIPDFARRSPN